MKRRQTFLAVLALLLMAVPAARGSAQTNAVDPVFTSTNINQLDMSYDEDTKVYTFNTTGGDPYVFTENFTEALPTDSNVISFEYQLDNEITDCQIFFPVPLAEANSIRGIVIPATEGDEWGLFQLRIGDYRTQNGWGRVGDQLRIDFCTESGVTIKVRNLHIGAYKESDDLQAYIDGLQYSADDYVFGDAPGCVGDEAAYTEFYEAYTDAVQLLGSASPTAEAKAAALTRLRAAYAAISAAVNTITDGTYYISTAYSVFEGKDTMAWYAPRVKGQPGWQKKRASERFMWNIKKLDDDNYSIQNVATGQYINHTASVDVADQPLTLTDELETEQVIASLGPNGQFLIHSNGANLSYNIQGHSSGNGTDGFIASWSDFTVNGEEAWRLTPVSAADLEAAQASRPADQLAIALSLYKDITDGAEVGPEAGKPHSQELVDETNAAIAAATAIVNGETAATAEETDAAREALVAAAGKFNAEVGNIPEGYYRIRSNYDVYASNYNDIYLSLNDGTTPGWAHYQNIPSQLWKIAKVDGGYTVQNAKNSLYLSKAAEAANGSLVSMTPQAETTQTFTPIKPNGKWYISNTEDTNFSYDPSGHGNGNNDSGPLQIWSPGGESAGTSWSVIPVSDEEAQNVIANEAQNTLAVNLHAAFDEARALYNANTDYTVGDAIVTSADQLYANNWSPNEGSTIQNLIDGSADSFWNSTWEGAGSEQDPTHPHYLRIYDEAGFPDTVQVSYTMRQSSSWHREPVKMRVDVSNDADSWETLYQLQEADFTANGKYNLSNLHSEPLHYILTGLEGYKFVRLICQVNRGADGVPYIVGNGHMMHEYSEFNLYPVTGVAETSATQQAWNKAIAAELLAALQEAKPQYAAGTATQATYDRLTAAIQNFKTENAGADEINNIYPRLNDIATLAEEGDGIGYVDSQSAVQDFWDAVQTAYDDFTSDAPQHSPAANLKTMQDAYYDLMDNHVNKPEPNKWYNIISNTTRAYGLDQPIYLWSTSTGDQLHVGNYQTDNFAYKSDPYAIWRLVPVEGEKYTYKIQSMGTGQYFGGYRGDGAGNSPLTSHDPGIYKLYYYGGSSANGTNRGGGFRLRQTNVINAFDNLKADGTNGVVLNWPANGDHQQAWRFEEITEGEMMQFNFFSNNSIQIITLPWATKGEGSLNAINGDNVMPYAIKNIEISNGGTALSLTRKDDIEAGEPMILVVGDYLSTDHSNTSAVQFNVPDDVVDTPVAANGLIGTLEGVTANAVGMGYFDGDFQLKATTGSQFFAGRSGYIDPGQIVNDEEAEENIVIYTTDRLNNIKNAKVLRGSETVNVYTIDGTLVKRNVKAANAKSGLAKGVYIIGKQKVLVR